LLPRNNIMFVKGKICKGADAKEDFDRGIGVA
jgi:hypothetical protein